MILGGTITARAATATHWDAIVVGAGPAGAFAARKLTRAGARVLLLDRQAFPREKICGGCLNRRTLSLLRVSGLGQLPLALGGQPLVAFELRTGAPPVTVALPEGIGVSRAALDAALVKAAAEAGAHFLPGVRALLGDCDLTRRQIELPDRGLRLVARVVLCADGIHGSFLTGEHRSRARPKTASRLGAGVVVRAAQVERPAAFRPGVIHMAVDRTGYVGAVRLENGRLGAAAALAPAAVREHGLARAANRILECRGLPPIHCLDAKWKGTGALTRQAPRVALERVFTIGDAAGYVEPFTGEGISWALETADGVRDIALEAIREWRPELELDWARTYRRRIVQRQRWCRSMAWSLRRPAMMRIAARLVRRSPRIASPLLAHLNAVPLGDRP